MLAIGFLQAILKTNGASLGMLFFYSGFLFFLGGVSTLVTHIFGTSWTAISANLQAAIVSAPIGKSFNEFKRGAITGSASGVRSYAGKQVGDGIRAVTRKYFPKDASQNALAMMGTGGSQSQEYTGRKDIKTFPKLPVLDSNTSTSVAHTGQNRSSGVVQERPQLNTTPVTSDGYSITNKKTGMTTTYLSKEDARADGYKPSQLRRTSLNGNYLNLTPEPDSKATPAKIRELLAANKDRFEQTGINGIILKDRSKRTNENITRIFTKEEKN